MSIQKYVGCTVELIYLDSAGKITHRRIVIRAVEDDTVRAFCLNRRAPRNFRVDNVLAVQPARHADRGGRIA